MNKPIVGITMGDPAGSGPEITIKALADPEQYSYCRPIVVGDVKVMEQAKKFVGREDIVIHRCEKVSDALFTPGTIDVLHLDLIEDISKFEIAKVSVECTDFSSPGANVTLAKPFNSRTGRKIVSDRFPT